MTIMRMFSSFIDDKIEELNAQGVSTDIREEFNQNLKIFTMRKNQGYVFYNHRNDKWFIMNEPPGAGKSTTISFAMAHRLNKDPNAKVVITVPQTFISKSFGATMLQYDDKQILWDIGTNLCEDSNTNKTSNIISFLKQKQFAKGIHNRIAITTHAALALVYNQIKDCSDIFDNTTFVIDEAHHVLYSDNGGSETANKIGELVKHIVTEENSTSSIWFASATFYRGDKGSIIPESIMSKFNRYYLPLDQHWNVNIKHIKNFNFNFVIYKQNKMLKEVKKIFKIGKHKTIIYCPYLGPLLNGGNKYKFRDDLIASIREIWPDCRFMDLVDESARNNRKKILLDNNTAKDIDVILSVRLFDEGSDWVFAEQIIDLVPSNSLRIQNQRFGRLWRDWPGKEVINYYAFLQHEAKFKNEEERRQHLSKSYSALVASMLLQEVISPITYPAKPLSSTGSNSQTTINPFEQELPDENKRQDVIKNVTKELMFLANMNDNPTVEEVKECIRTVLTNAGITNNQDSIISHIGKLLRRQSANSVPKKPTWNNDVDVSWMREEGFDKIWNNDILGYLLTFGTGISDIKTFKEFREVYGSNKTLDEWIKIAEQLAEDNDGKLPPISHIIKMGYNGLYNILRTNPHIFAHIPREYLKIKGNNPEEWVKIAEQLAEDNGGQLYSITQLKNMNYSGLVSALQKFPDKFNHILRLNEKDCCNTPEEWVKIAEQLAEDNGGKLPIDYWLTQNGFCGLPFAIKNNPKLFEHIPRNVVFKTLDEWVKIAEQLAEDNGGKLPNATKLYNDHSGLLGVIYDNPELFKHIPREYLTTKQKSPEEWVKIAEQLAEDNGGKLPTTSWLRQNNLPRILALLYKRPELFKHIPRENKKDLEKSPEEWVKIAEQLAKDNNGKLPTITWLKNNNCGGLTRTIQTHAHLFNHITREYLKKHKNATEWITIVDKLIETNNGVLHSMNWLCQNGYPALSKYINTHKHLFKGIKQHYRNTIRTIGEDDAPCPST